MRIICVVLLFLAACNDTGLLVIVDKDLKHEKRVIRETTEAVKWFSDVYGHDYEQFTTYLTIKVQKAALVKGVDCYIDGVLVEGACNISGLFHSSSLIEVMWKDGPDNNSLIHELLHYELWNYQDPSHVKKADYINEPEDPHRPNHSPRFLQTAAKLMEQWRSR